MMNWFRESFHRIRSYFGRTQLDRDLDDEMATHLDLAIEENLQRGMSPDEARRQALIRFGGTTQAKEQHREARSLPFIESLLQDLRFALRMLRKNPGFAIVAVTTLTLGIGAATAIFSVIYGVLIRPLAVPEGRQVLEVVLTYRSELSQDAFTYEQFRYLQDHTRWPAAVASFTHAGLNLSSGEETQRVSVLHVSSDYFRVLGASPILGRDFNLDEDCDPSARVVILSHPLWKQQFAGDPAILERSIRLNGAPYRIIGVMPATQADVQMDLVPSAFGDLQHVDLWTTLAPVATSIGSGENLQIIARLKPNLTIKQASAEMDALTPSFRQDQLEGDARQQSVGLSSVQNVMATSVSTYLWILLAAVAFLLLIACANISNLMLARGAGRMTEMALRSALGAGRWRLMRQLLLESLVLAALGGFGGFLVTRLAAAFFLRFLPDQLPRAAEVHVDGWAFLFTLAVSALSGVIAGIAPALRGAKTDVGCMLKESASQSSASPHRSNFRNGLVVFEIALSLVLLIGAALLAETFLNLLRVNPGFQTDRMLSAEIWLTGSRVHSRAQLASFYENLIARTKQLPGVQNAAVVSSGQPLERGGNLWAAANGVSLGSRDFRVVTHQYFRTLGVALLRGRDFEASDSETSEPVAIVNEAFVLKVLKDRDPLTSTVQVGTSDQPRRIVGVAADVKSFVGFPADPTIFIPAPQAKMGLILGFDVWFPTHILVRASGDPWSLVNSLDSVIRQTDSSIPVGHILPMEQVLVRSLTSQRFMMSVVAVFAALAMALAAVGIYGLISFSVSRRTHELGVRMALGANPGDVVSMVLRQGARLALLGVLIGLVGALALQHMIASVLFGVQPTDWRTAAAACFCLLGIAFFACYIPARRATRIDPMTALRYE
jgi:predicted permease